MYLSVFICQEQELYKKEGLGLTEVKYIDNQDCIGKLSHAKSISLTARIGCVGRQNLFVRLHFLSLKYYCDLKTMYLLPP